MYTASVRMTVRMKVQPSQPTHTTPNTHCQTKTIGLNDDNRIPYFHPPVQSTANRDGSTIT